MAIHYDSCATHLKAVQDVLLDDLYVNVVCIQCMSHLFNRAGTDVYLVQSPWYTVRIKGGVNILLHGVFALTSSGVKQVSSF